MNKEKIVKLIKSGSYEDILIAFHLLKGYTFKDISNFPELDHLAEYGYCHFLNESIIGDGKYHKINDDLYGYIGGRSVAFRTHASKIGHVEVIDL